MYGLDYVMNVRDYRALAGEAELVPFDDAFDLARAVKSEAELASVRDSVRINEAGMWETISGVRAGQDGGRGARAGRAAVRGAGHRPPR